MMDNALTMMTMTMDAMTTSDICFLYARCFFRVSVVVRYTCRWRFQMSAVALCGSENVPGGRFVHHETMDWVLTSDHPIEFVWTCDDDSVYNERLPGRLGMFVYPKDVRFHVSGKNRTSRADFDAVVRTERAMLIRERAQNMHHLTVSHELENDFVPNQDAQNESEEDEEEEGEGEEGEENTAIEECLESDEEGEA